MGSFTFTLQTVLDAQNHKERQAHKDLLEAHLVLENAGLELSVLREQMEAFDQDVGVSRRQNQLLSHVLATQNYRKSLLHKIERQMERLEEAKTAFEEKRILLLEVMQRRKILEQVRAKHFQAWEERQQNLEAAFLDEIATSRHRFKPR